MKPTTTKRNLDWQLVTFFGIAAAVYLNRKHKRDLITGKEA
jgi:hypothetical protein